LPLVCSRQIEALKEGQLGDEEVRGSPYAMGRWSILILPYDFVLLKVMASVCVSWTARQVVCADGLDHYVSPSSYTRVISFSRTVSHVERAVKYVFLATRIIPSRVLGVCRAAKASFADIDLSAHPKKKDRRGTSRSVLMELYARDRRELSGMDCMRLEHHQGFSRP